MELHERLIAARKHAGFESAKDAATALAIAYPTYAGHENGSSGFRADKGRRYAKRFKVRFEWLMTGVGPMTDASSKHREVLELYDSLPPELQASYLAILRTLATPGLAGQQLPELQREEPLKDG